MGEKKKAAERNRTPDPRFTKALLYQLSYGGDERIIAGSVGLCRNLEFENIPELWPKTLSFDDAFIH